MIVSPERPSEVVPLKPAATSVGLGWVGLVAIQFRGTHSYEFDDAVCTHHLLALFVRPPELLDVRFAGVTRPVSPCAGSIDFVPAGASMRVRSMGYRDEVHVFLEPRLIERVAAEAFELDPVRLSIPPLHGEQHSRLRALMLALGQELAVAGEGDLLAAESLANLLAVQLIRNAFPLRPPTRRTEGVLPRTKLHAVIEYIEEHLDTALTLAQMAKAVHLSAFHFARQFKAATGSPPHRYVVARRVERAQQLLRESEDLSLAEIATHVGFSDQSQLSNHFKRVVGVTPRQFRKPARIR